MVDRVQAQSNTGVIPLRQLFHFSHFSHFYRLYIPASLLIGSVCGLFMVLFQSLIDATTIGLLGIPVFLAPLIGGLFSGALIYLGRNEIEGSGISKAIELTHNPVELTAQTAVTKMVATSISIGSGNPVGREGPAVLIGAAIGNYMGRRFGYDDPPHLRVFIMMGSAACTAGIYKAPLGGALFASEAPYKRDARLGYFVPTVLAAITSYMVFAIILGINPLLSLNVTFSLTLEVLPFVIILGVVAGCVAIFFSVFLMFMRNLFKVRLPDWADPIAGSLLGCVIIFIVGLWIAPELTVAGLGYNVIESIASSATTIALSGLLLLMVGKLLATSFVVAGRVSGGVLASSIFVGAMLGAIFGEVFFPDSVAAFVVLGMGAVLAANTNTPVATTILILEISHSFDLLIPLAICISISYLVGGGTSLYEGQKVTRDDEDPDFFARVNVIPEGEDLLSAYADANPVNHEDSDSVPQETDEEVG
ncbi:MAG: chloride channel protein [Candidatus Sifarchaeia archaeon]